MNQFSPATVTFRATGGLLNVEMGVVRKVGENQPRPAHGALVDLPAYLLDVAEILLKPFKLEIQISRIHEKLPVWRWMRFKLVGRWAHPLYT